MFTIRKSQKTRQSTVQEITGVQSWISRPPLTAPKHYKTSILGAVIVSERGFLEPPFFPERRVVGLLSFAHTIPLKIPVTKACHNKASRPDFRNQRFEPDTENCRKRGRSLSPHQNKPKGPFRTKNSTALDSVVFCYRRSFLLSVPFSCLFFLEKQALLSTLRSVLLLP